MQRIRHLLAYAFLALLTGTASAAEWGESYLPVDPPAGTISNDKVEVVEFFWYGCPHCFDIDPYVTEWSKSKPANVEFHHVPAPLNPQWEVHARFFYAAKYLGVLDKLHAPLFTAMHREKQSLSDKGSLIEFAVAHGVDRKKFTQAWNSFDVAVRVQQAKQLAQRYNIESVPTMGINGKYKTSVSTAGSVDKMFAVVNDLVAEEVAAKSSQAAPATAASEKAAAPAM